MICHSPTRSDDADRLTSTIYPNGGPAITNVFDAGEHLLQVKQVGGTNFYTATGFNALNQLNGINFGNGVATTLGYYSVSRRLQQIVSAKSGNVQNLTYSYDTNGNVTAVADGVYSGSASAAISSAVYDDLNRLTSATWTGYGTRNYAYSSVGNVLTNSESGTSNYVYGAIRPHCVRSANGMWFTYDQNGNVVFRSGQRLDYDVNDRLYRVIGTNGVVTTFGYDANGARLWELSGTNALQVWIGNNYEEKSGQILYHINAGGRLVATFDKTGTNVFQYYHPDDLTSTSIQTDKNGNEIQNYEYSAFGQSRYTQSTNVFKVSRRYTGQVLDDATGLYYYNFRYYDPMLARFIQPDDIIPNFAVPQSYNRYSYCVNNPLRYTDPDGNSASEVLANASDFTGEFIVGSVGEVGFGINVGSPTSTAGYNGRITGRSVGTVVSGYVTAKGAADIVIGSGTMSLSGEAEGVTGGGATVVAGPAFVAGAVKAMEGVAEGAVGTWGLHNAMKLQLLEKPKGSPAKSAASEERETNIKKGVDPKDLGPSGKPKAHVVKKSTRKETVDAARNAGGSKPIKHTQDKGQPTHYHPTDRTGKKLTGRDNVHYQQKGSKPNN